MLRAGREVFVRAARPSRIETDLDAVVLVSAPLPEMSPETTAPPATYGRLLRRGCVTPFRPNTIHATSIDFKLSPQQSSSVRPSHCMQYTDAEPERRQCPVAALD